MAAGLGPGTRVWAVIFASFGGVLAVGGVAMTGEVARFDDGRLVFYSKSRIRRSIECSVAPGDSLIFWKAGPFRVVSIDSQNGHHVEVALATVSRRQVEKFAHQLRQHGINAAVAR